MLIVFFVVSIFATTGTYSEVHIWLPRQFITSSSVCYIRMKYERTVDEIFCYPSIKQFVKLGNELQINFSKVIFITKFAFCLPFEYTYKGRWAFGGSKVVKKNTTPWRHGYQLLTEMRDHGAINLDIGDICPSAWSTVHFVNTLGPKIPTIHTVCHLHGLGMECHEGPACNRSTATQSHPTTSAKQLRRKSSWFLSLCVSLIIIML